MGLVHCTSSFVVANQSGRLLRGRIGPVIVRFLGREKLALSRRGAAVAGVCSNFSFLNFGIEGFNGELCASPSGSTRGHFETGVNSVIGKRGVYGRRSLVQVLGPMVAN